MGSKALDGESEQSGEVVQRLVGEAFVKGICRTPDRGRKGAEIGKESEKGSKRETKCGAIFSSQAAQEVEIRCYSNKQTNRKLRSPSEKLKRQQAKAELAKHDR